MHQRIRRIIPVFLLLIAGAAAIWYFTRNNNAVSDELSASGTIEAVQVAINPELGGRISAILVEEGDLVSVGQTLVQLDATLYQTQRQQAEASLDMTQLHVKAAQAAVESAEAAQAAAQAGYDAALANRDLLASGATEQQRQAAQAQLEQAEANLRALQANLDAATSGSRPEAISTARLRLKQAWETYTRLTASLSEEQIEAVQTAFDLATENLSRAQARQTRLENQTDLPISAAEAAQNEVADCQAALALAQQALQAAQDASQPYYQQIAVTRSTWELAQQNASQAAARQETLRAIEDMPDVALEAAQEAADDADDLVETAREAYDALVEDEQANRLDEAWSEVLAAQTQLNALGRTPTQASQSVSLEAMLNQVDAARAVREVAAANLAQLESGARTEQLAAAEAQVAAAQAQMEAASAQVKAAQVQVEIAQAQTTSAQAALEIVDVQIAKLTIASPVEGVVLSRSMEAGEVIAAGASVLTIGQLQDLTITVYLPEDRYGEISLGEKAGVRVDSFPNVVFMAQVVHIADQAEFTPRNVQTAEGRRTTVFAVRLAIDVSDGRLKPGMPADVTFKK
jgi:HlyD family secretion protein